MKSSFKPVIAVAVLGLTLSLVSFFIWVEVNDPKNDMVFGRVVRVDATSLVIANRENEEMSVAVTPGTKVLQGDASHTIATLSTGNFVQISFVEGGVGTSTASTIRILRSPNEDKNHGPR